MRLTYCHSLLGAELVAAGFVVASREYACGGQADPFRLPRAVREIALARRGHDMDDAASYPRACLDVFRTGRAESRVFLSGVNREAVLVGVGEYFFGDGPAAWRKKRRKWVKELFNALDNDGEVGAWRRRCARDGHAVRGATSAAGASVDLGGGVMFNLAAYAQSREALTDEFARLMPAMVTYVQDFLRAHDKARVCRAELTAKSYFLQEAEGLSRQAKVAWAARRGDARVTNLQHDGIVVELPEGMDAKAMEAGMSLACTAVLGYGQPVEEKELGADVSDTESESDGA